MKHMRHTLALQSAFEFFDTKLIDRHYYNNKKWIKNSRFLLITKLLIIPTSSSECFLKYFLL